MGNVIPPAFNGLDPQAVVSADRPATDYTARVIPDFAGAKIPLENTRILWNA